MNVARSLGLSVPRDVSVIGFDNIPESALTEPPLTTIDQSIQKMGQEAVRLLVEMMEGTGNGPRQITLPTRLVVRQSCQRVGASAMSAPPRPTPRIGTPRGPWASGSPTCSPG